VIRHGRALRPVVETIVHRRPDHPSRRPNRKHRAEETVFPRCEPERRRRCAVVALFTLLFTASLVGALASPARGQESQRAIGPSVLDGVYTSAQARRGQEQFEQHCASCHRSDLSGFSGPPLKGDRFLDQWREFPLDVLFKVMQSQMPLGNPSGLPPSTYLDLAAYILEANGLPPGTQELTLTVVATVLLVGPGGPKPLPTSAPALIAGCLTKEPGNGWFLTNASDPVRTLNPFEFADAELGAASLLSPGRELFRLQNLEDLPGSIDAADRLVGKRVLAKGILVRHEKGNRLNVAALNAVGGACEP
jgi:mono/diheme cytochrome c family protein